MAEAQILPEQFDDFEQQAETSISGMWAFLASEIVFFGGLFLSYIVYRTTYPQAFSAGSHQSNVLLGSINTAVLLTSSLTMALALEAARDGLRKPLVMFLSATELLGLAFLIIKGVEYAEHISFGLWPGPHFKTALPQGTELFFILYFLMTGLHAVHLIIGCGVVSVILWMACKRKFSQKYHTPVEVTGLYWHFIDLMWVFLYPLFYLIPR